MINVMTAGDIATPPYPPQAYTDPMNDLTISTLSDLVNEGYNLTPVHLEPMTKGTNNHSFLVTTADTDYVLKWHQNAFAIEQLGFQFEVLRALDAMHLPFAVPSPIPTKYGDLHLSTEHNDEPIVLTISRRIVGTHPGIGDPQRTFSCGKALGILSSAMSLITPSQAIETPVVFTALDEQLLPQNESMGSIAQIFDVSATKDLLTSIESEWQDQTSTWPQQLIHGDFFSPNVLMDNGEVTGVLDFEFSGLGHRAMDLAVGLRAFGFGGAGWNVSWPMIERFAKGFLTQIPLPREELHAIPSLLLKRESSSFEHWLGRMNEGLTDYEDMRDRADRLIALNRWIHANRQQLVEVLDTVETG